MQEWIKEAQNMEKIGLDSNLLNKKVTAKKVFGSNLLLQNKLVRASAPDSDSFLADSPADSLLNSGGNPWDALRASHLSVGLSNESRIMVPRTRVELVTYRSSGGRSIRVRLWRISGKDELCFEFAEANTLSNKPTWCTEPWQCLAYKLSFVI